MKMSEERKNEAKIRKKRDQEKERERIKKDVERRKKALRTLTVMKNIINRKENIKLRSDFMVARFLSLYFLATRYGNDQAKKYLETEFRFSPNSKPKVTKKN